ncbi:MAG: helix-turn-helix domain-containing protein [Firmicutes bacterium]|nr:helix-turn-helix domain-containing protein [Bacillota bacterium]
MDYYKELKESLECAVSYVRGDKSRCRTTVRELPVTEYKPADVARVRLALNLSQRGLACVLGVSPRTVEAWEGGKNAPNGSARNLLYLIDNNHDLVQQLVA